MLVARYSFAFSVSPMLITGKQNMSTNLPDLTTRYLRKTVNNVPWKVTLFLVMIIKRKMKTWKTIRPIIPASLQSILKKFVSKIRWDNGLKETHMSKKFSNTVDLFGIDGIVWNLRFLEFHFNSERPNLSC